MLDFEGNMTQPAADPCSSEPEENQKNLDENAKEQNSNNSAQNDSEENAKEQKNNKNNALRRRQRTREVSSRYKLGISTTVKKYNGGSPDERLMPSERSMVHSSRRCSLVHHPRFLGCSSIDYEAVSKRARPEMPPPPAARNLDYSSHVLANIPIPNAKGNSENEDNVSYDDLPLDLECKGGTEKQKLGFKEKDVEYSENARPNEKLSKQDRLVRPQSASVRLLGAEMMKSMDAMDRPQTQVRTFKVPSSSNRSMETPAVPKSSASGDGRGTVTTSRISRSESLQARTVNNKFSSTVNDGGQQQQEQKQHCSNLNNNESEAEGLIEETDKLNDPSSDTESVCSVATVSNASGKARVPRKAGTIVAARFLQDARSKIRKSSDAEFSVPSKFSHKGNNHGDAMPKSSEYLNLMCKPRNGAYQFPAPPPQFRMPSHSRSLSPVDRREHLQGQTLPQKGNPGNELNTSTYLKSDAPKLKLGTGMVMNQAETSHQLRMLYNRMLQWRFVNAKAAAATNIQTLTAQKLLYSVMCRISELSDSVARKKVELQQAKHACILNSILSKQLRMLEDFELLQTDHSGFVSELIKYLQAAAIRLPVTDGVRVDAQLLKEAFDSAAEVMQSLSSYIDPVFPMVEKTNTFCSELAHVVAQERLLIDECSDMLATADFLLTREFSLMAQLIQLKQDTQNCFSGATENGADIN